jgi:tungstate transport system substrate-binding protein
MRRGAAPVLAQGLALAAGMALPVALAAQQPAARDVVVATTTSFRDTGLLDSIVPLFERASGYRVRVVAVGSGQAMRMGQRGDADVVIAHSPRAEEEFVRAGHAVRRRHIASNYFTIAGPPADPAGIRGAPDAAAALARIAAAGAVFVSRGDSSGTHARELALWSAAGRRTEWGGYIESGQGQSATLLIADERRGYTLTDRATFGALRRRLALVPLRGPEVPLLNRYSVLELNPAGRPRLNVAGGTAFADFLVSGTVQTLLRTFGTGRFGEPLFTPAAP